MTEFPPFAVNIGDAVKLNGCLVIPARVELGNCQEVSRYRLLATSSARVRSMVVTLISGQALAISFLDILPWVFTVVMYIVS